LQGPQEQTPTSLFLLIKPKPHQLADFPPHRHMYWQSHRLLDSADGKRSTRLPINWLFGGYPMSSKRSNCADLYS
jgi:hypothetical protein